uniref:Uncharacterized protein n=1 Tax=Utricularia reniformis TaxID=192314 RepID=A0A1Y0AZ11_9LAMI|nr:hypothetical protein AEK19_MT1646 [Utricularia reniformis]ART30394.1 hypothetical protein AEK19_MT1646 [Utricularia reniformis]
MFATTLAAGWCIASSSLKEKGLPLFNKITKPSRIYSSLSKMMSTYVVSLTKRYTTPRIIPSFHRGKIKKRYSVVIVP